MLHDIYQFTRRCIRHWAKVVSLKSELMWPILVIANQYLFSIWTSALPDIFREKWILGVHQKHGGIRERYVAKSPIAQQGFKTHNAWIDLLASTGILGFATMIGFSIKKVEFWRFPLLKFKRNMLMDGSNFQFLIIAALTGLYIFS
ncbi:hypothetical protein U7537_13940 [Lacticaseibacillus rhamnosus]